MVSKLWSISIG